MKAISARWPCSSWRRRRTTPCPRRQPQVRVAGHEACAISLAPGQSWQGQLGCAVLAVFRLSAQGKGRGAGRCRPPLSPPLTLVGKQARGHGGRGTRGQRVATSHDEGRCCVAVGFVAAPSLTAAVPRVDVPSSRGHVGPQNAAPLQEGGCGRPRGPCAFRASGGARDELTQRTRPARGRGHKQTGSRWCRLRAPGAPGEASPARRGFP